MFTILLSLVSGTLVVTTYLLLYTQYVHAGLCAVPLVVTLFSWSFISGSYLHLNQRASLEVAVAADEAHAATDPTRNFRDDYYLQPALDRHPDKALPPPADLDDPPADGAPDGDEKTGLRHIFNV